MSKHKLVKKKENPDFYKVLQVLYYFIEQEAMRDTGETLKYMDQVKKRIIELAVDLGNLAYLDNWYNKEVEGELKELVECDEKTGHYTPKKDI